MQMYFFIIGDCAACGKTFGFNPKKVPSFRKTPTGPRLPLCRSCAERVNVMKKKAGMQVFLIDRDAYEPVKED